MQLHEFAELIRESDGDYPRDYSFSVIRRKDGDVFLARSSMNDCLFYNTERDVWGYVDVNRYQRMIVGIGTSINSAVVRWVSERNDSERAYRKMYPYAW